MDQGRLAIKPILTESKSTGSIGSVRLHTIPYLLRQIEVCFLFHVFINFFHDKFTRRERSLPA